MTTVARERAGARYRTIRVTPLVPAIGADIHGVELSAGVDDMQFEEIRRAFLDHHVLFFHAQALTPERFVAFAQRFGELQHNDNTSFGRLDAHRYIEVLDYDGQRPPLVTKEMWHTDFTGHDCPTLGTLLYCLEAPASGGDTIWVSLEAAYDALSEPMKRYLAGLTAEHRTIKSFGDDIRGNIWRTDEDRQRLERIRLRPPAVHPAVRTHPETGRKALFVNEGYTTRLIGVDHKESDAVLAYLFDHVRVPEFQCRFRWRAGSLAVWDNRVTQHYAVADYAERRLMHRIAIKGDRPC